MPQAMTRDILKWGGDPESVPVLTGGRLNAKNTLGFWTLSPRCYGNSSSFGNQRQSERGYTITYNGALINNAGFARTVQAKIFVQLPDGSAVDLQGSEIYTVPAFNSLVMFFSVPGSMDMVSLFSCVFEP